MRGAENARQNLVDEASVSVGNSAEPDRVTLGFGDRSLAAGDDLVGYGQCFRAADSDD